MKINGKDITEYGKVRQWRVDIGNRELKNDSEWVRGSPLPFFDANSAGFKPFTVTLMVYGNSREEIKWIISNIISDLLAPVGLELDGWQHRFYGILQKSNVREYTDRSRNRWQTLELQFDGYEYMEPEATTVNELNAFEVVNPGNTVSPVIIELTPTVGAASVTVSGICRDSKTGEDLPVTLRNVVTGKKIVLDGITGLITEDGKLKDADIWELPTFKPGVNTITLSTNRMNAHVRVRALYV